MIVWGLPPSMRWGILTFTLRYSAQLLVHQAMYRNFWKYKKIRLEWSNMPYKHDHWSLTYLVTALAYFFPIENSWERSKLYSVGLDWIYHRVCNTDHHNSKSTADQMCSKWKWVLLCLKYEPKVCPVLKGSDFQSKYLVPVLRYFWVGKTANFRERGEGSLQSEKFVAKKRNRVFWNEGGKGGEGSEAIWKFSENSSKKTPKV